MKDSNTYRRNESCIVGLPRCDYVFNSNRSCFIAYGFNESALEMEILKDILRTQNMEVFEAGGDLEPGKNAFCTKICSKIITSQFSIVLLNHDTKNGHKIPNANVNMEYGLMLGFNKYVIPFQREDENLPFNVSGLDTIKYNQANFKVKAQNAIQKAIEQTRPMDEKLPVDRIIEKFLMIKEVLMVSIDDLGHKNMFELGNPFGYYLLNDFAGLKYYYLGVFNLLTIDQIKWRINKLARVIEARFDEDSLKQKIEFGVTNEFGVSAALKLRENTSAWVITGTNEEKTSLEEFVTSIKLPFTIFSLSDINQDLEREGLNT